MSKYTIKVTQVTTLTIEADDEESALETAYEEYLEHDADSVDAEVVSDDE